MEKRIALRLDAQTDAQLEALSQAIGFSKEMAAVYAVRLVCACMREGLIEDMPMRAWPHEARLLKAAAGKVIDFPGGKTVNAQSRA